MLDELLANFANPEWVAKRQAELDAQEAELLAGMTDDERAEYNLIDLQIAAVIKSLNDHLIASLDSDWSTRG